MLQGPSSAAADLALAKRSIAPDNHRAVHEGRITEEEPRSLGQEGSPFGPAPKTISKNDRTPTKTPCSCGCGEPVPRTFRAGHDVRLVSLAKAHVRGEAERPPSR